MSGLFDLFNDPELDGFLQPEPPPPPEPDPEPVRVLLPSPPKPRLPPPPPKRAKTGCKWCNVSAGCRCCEKCGSTTENHHSGCTLAPRPATVIMTEAQRLTVAERAWLAATAIRPLIAPGTPGKQTEQLVNEMQQIIVVQMEAALLAALN